SFDEDEITANPGEVTTPSPLLEDRFATLEEAGRAATLRVLQQSRDEGKEYAGLIVRLADGTFAFTEAEPGSEKSSEPGWSDEPIIAGVYHTHGRESDNYK